MPDHRPHCPGPLTALLLLPLAASGALANPGRDLAQLSLEELGDIQVTSVSRRAESLADAPASAYVITGTEIRRSGFRTLPEVLRLAPNLHVARGTGYGYAISARGLNGSNTSSPNKLLVLVDGRSVYSPLFSGVFWDVQDLVLEDIERIEVVSGPGGTLWGVNAVNGIINVITRRAGDTPGTFASFGTGTAGTQAVLRHGGRFGADGSWRAYAKGVDQRHTETDDAGDIDDALQRFQAGFRTDWAAGTDSLTVTGDAYRGRQGQPEPGAIAVAGVDLVLGDIDVSGANLNAQWRRQLDGGGTLMLQAVYDYTSREVPPTFAEDLSLLDLKLQHSLRPRGPHSLTWGLDFRHGRDRIDNSVHFAFLPADLDSRWTALFLQDEVQLRPDLRLVAGVRLERNDYTGTELLPNLRLAWNPSETHMLWTALSRAVRAPSRLDHDAHIPGVPPFLLDGGPEVRSEVSDVFEVGYRGEPTARLSLSATAFAARHDDLRTTELAPSGTYLVFGNRMQGRSRGLEAWGRFEATPAWRISGGLTLLDEDLRLKPGSFDTTAPAAAGNNPAVTWQLRSTWAMDERRDLDIGLRHVARLDRADVPAYTTLDIRYGWRFGDRLEASITGRDLLGGHAEYGPAATRIEVRPSVFVELAWGL